MVGQSDGANALTSPGTDGGGSGVPTSSVINSITALANSVATDVAVDYRAVSTPTPTQQAVSIGSIGLLPILLLFGAGYLIFKAVD